VFILKHDFPYKLFAEAFSNEYDEDKKGKQEDKKTIGTTEVHRSVCLGEIGAKLFC
jgi:hypothetical protein